MGMTLINNYEMPSNCYICDLHNYHECDLTGESIEEDYCWNGDSREKHCPLREIEAIPRADYENRLKADVVAMLTDIQLEIAENIESIAGRYDKFTPERDMPSKKIERNEDRQECINIIQQKIDKLKGE